MADNEVQIDSLTIAVEESAGNAAKNLSELASSLKKLQKAASELKLGETINQLRALGNTMSVFSSFADAIGKLNGVKISSTIAKQLTAVGKAMTDIPEQDITKLARLGDALRPLGQLGRAQLTSFINQLGKLPELSRQLDSVDMEKFASQVERLTAAMKPLADEMEKISQGFSKFPMRIQKFITNNEKATGSAKTATSSWSKFFNVLTNGSKKSESKLSKLAKSLLSVAAFRATVNKLEDALDSANKYVEDLNLFNVSMGEFTEEGQKYAETVGESYGIDPAEFMRMQAVTMDMSKSFGVASDTAYTMSKALTQLTYDISSLYNLNIEEAASKVQSALAGEIEPIRRLGKDLSVANLKLLATELGINANVDSMNQAEKAMLRTISLLRQSTSAMGDMARTLDQPANQFRVLKAQITLLGRAVGDLLLPIVQKALPYLIALVKVAQRVVMAFAKLAGFELPKFDYADSTVSDIEKIGDVADDAAASVKKLYTLSFDELNILGSQNSSGSGSGTSAEDLAKLEAELNRLAQIENDAFSAALGEGADKIAESMENWLTKGQGIEKWAESVSTKFTSIKNTAKNVADQLGLWEIPAALSELLSSLGLDIDFGTVNANFGKTKLGKISGESALKSLLGNGLGLALGVGALAALTGDGGNLLAKGIGLALGIGAVKMLLDEVKLGEVDGSESNGLLKSLKTGLMIALAGTSMSLLSGKGLTYSIPLGLSLASLYLGFNGVSALYDSTPDNDLQGAVQTAISGALLGSSLMLLKGTSGLKYTLPIALSILGVSVLFSGAKLLTNGKSDDNLQGILLSAIGVAVMGAAGAKAASLLGVSAASGGAVGLAVGFALSISFFLDDVGVYDKMGNWAKKTGNVLKEKIDETFGKEIYTDGTWVESIIDTVNKAGEYAYDVISSVFDSKTIMPSETQSRVSESFEKAGESIGDGITKGMENHEEVLKRGSKKMAEAIDAQFREELGIHSPSTVFAEHGMNIDQGLANGVIDNLNVITDAFGNVYSQIELRFDSFANSMLTKAQSFVSQLSRVLSSASMSGTGSLKASFANRTPAYASGGFPEDGVFYANSHELVGRFSNGRTAVANNQQITEGIRQAVYEAVRAAQNESGRSGGKIELILDKQVVGRAFGDAIDTERRRSGANTKITFSNGGNR